MVDHVPWPCAVATAKRLKMARRNNLAGWILVSPVVVGLATFTLYPFLASFYLSTAPHKWGAENHAARLSWHLAITLATDFVDQLNGCAC